MTVTVDDYNGNTDDDMQGCEWRRQFWLGRRSQLSEEGKSVQSK